MWCFVILIVSLTFTTQSTSGQHPQHLNNRLRHLNNVEVFRMASKEHRLKSKPVQVEKEEDINLEESKPLILHRRRTTPTTRPAYHQQLSAKDHQYLEDKLVRSFGRNYKRSHAYKRIINACKEDKRQPDRVYNLNTAPYISTQSQLCNAHTDLLIAVHTRPTNFENRQLIRDTYGSMRNVHGRRVVIAFFIGNSGDRVTQRRIDEETRNYRDIVQRDFKEHYRNMTLKHLTIMDWIMEYCDNAKFLVKADDDVFVNIFQVLTFVETFPPNGFYCSRTNGPKPMRKSGKWKLTYEEYPRKTFPPYCMGYGYVMRAVHAKSLFWCSVYSKFLWIDDVLVGGLLPEKLRLNIEGFINGHSVTYILPSHASDKIADYMFLLGSRNAVIPSIFRRIWKASLQYSY